MLHLARFVCEFSVVVSGPPFYYVQWNIFGKMNVNHMTKRSSAIWQRVKGILLYFYHRIISDPNESPLDMLSDVVLKIILSPVWVGFPRIYDIRYHWQLYKHFSFSDPLEMSFSFLLLVCVWICYRSPLK